MRKNFVHIASSALTKEEALERLKDPDAELFICGLGEENDDIVFFIGESYREPLFSFMLQTPEIEDQDKMWFVRIYDIQHVKYNKETNDYDDAHGFIIGNLHVCSGSENMINNKKNNKQRYFLLLEAIRQELIRQLTA